MELIGDNFIENGKHIVVLHSPLWNAGFRGEGESFEEARQKAEFTAKALMKSWEENN